MKLEQVKSRINNLVKVDTLTKLITEFNICLKSVLEFDESIIYFYDDNLLKVKGYRYFNNNVYHKTLDLDINNTLFEKSFLLGETILTSKLDMSCYFKKESYLSLGVNQVLSIPLNDGYRNVGTIEFKQRDTYTVEIDYIKELVYLFTIKLIDFLYFNEIKLENIKNRSYLNELQIITFSSVNNQLSLNDKVFSKIIHKMSEDKISKKKYTYNKQIYEININYTSSTTFDGYINQVNNFIKKTTDKNEEINSIFSKEQLIKRLVDLDKEKQVFAITRFSFKENFVKIVYEILKTKYNEIYKVYDEFIVISFVTDKRTIRHTINFLEKEFSNTLTLDVVISTIIANKEFDDIENILEVLDVMIKQRTKFYSKDILKNYYDERSTSSNFKSLVNSRNFKIYARAILNFHKEIVAYYLNSEFFSYKFDDNRFNLIVLDEILKKVLKVLKHFGPIYYIEVPNYLISNVNMFDYITKKCQTYKYAKENICFVVTNFTNDSHTIDFVKRMINNDYKIGLVNELDMMFHKNYAFKISSMFLDVQFIQENKAYFNFLKKMSEDRFTEFIFTVESNEEFVSYQRLDFGTCITVKTFDFNTLKY